MSAEASPATNINWRKADTRIFERAAHDFYCEPADTVHALLDAEPFDGEIWDPACGRGNIPIVCEARGFPTFASDIVDRGYAPAQLIDFLSCDYPIAPSVPNIISNPPFGQAEEFARKSLLLARRKVAFLLRFAFYESVKRRDFFHSTPLARVHVFSWRVSMPPGDIAVEAKGGMVAFAWFVWEKGHKGPPTLHRLERTAGRK